MHLFFTVTVSVKHAYRPKSANKRMVTSIDMRDEELIFGFMPMPPWLGVLEARLAAGRAATDLNAAITLKGDFFQFNGCCPPLLRSCLDLTEDEVEFGRRTAGLQGA